MRRPAARRIAKILRGLLARPHWWTDHRDVKDALYDELRRLGITYNPADLDDAISWVDAALSRRGRGWISR